MNSLLQALLRSGPNFKNPAYAELSESRDLMIAQGAMPYTEMARTGGTWNVFSAAATPLATFPSTTCILEIYNSMNSGMVMEFQDLLVYHLLSTAVQHSVGVWAQVTPPKQAAPTLAALLVGSQSGQAPYTTTAGSRVVTAAGTTIVLNGWRPFGQPGSGAVGTATPGEALSVPVEGKLIVPPGCSLAITATDTVATAASVQVGASWNERPLLTPSIR